MVGGLSIENAETIIMDIKNNTYDGPEGVFKIIVDEFDGKTISAWHIEDKYGEKSRNLGSVKCKSLDTIVGHVGLYVRGKAKSKLHDLALGRLKWRQPEMVNKLIQENQYLKSKQK